MNGENIVSAMELSAAAYRGVQPYTPGKCVAVDVYGHADVHFYLRRKEDVLSITFRGTDSLKDWKADFSFWKKTIAYGNHQSRIRVHHGFYGLYTQLGVRDRIMSEIVPGVNRVLIAGHSLGAALAVLCAVDVQYNEPELDIETILFGCPRVGNKAFALSYNKRVDKTVRIENGCDIITKVPPAIFGFRHVGAKLHVGPPRLPFIARAADHYPHRYYAGVLEKVVF